MAERTSRHSNDKLVWGDAYYVSTKGRYGLKISPNPREDNKPLTNKPLEMKDWMFHDLSDQYGVTMIAGEGFSYYTVKDGVYWQFRKDRPIPATENGWISADHDPPRKDDYLAYNSEYGWSRKYWSGSEWMSTWDVEMWKPVLTPEKPEDPKRFIYEKGNPFLHPHNYTLKDTESDFVVEGLKEDKAVKLSAFLNEQFKDQCQCS